MFVFSAVSVSEEIILYCIIGFNKLEVVLVCLRLKDFLLLLNGFFAVWEFFNFIFQK